MEPLLKDLWRLLRLLRLLLLLLLLTAPPGIFQYQFGINTPGQEELRRPLSAPLSRPGLMHLAVGTDSLSRGEDLTSDSLAIARPIPRASPRPDTAGHCPTGGHILFVRGDYWTTSSSGEVTFHTPRSIKSVPLVAPTVSLKKLPINRPAQLLLHPIDLSPINTYTFDWTRFNLLD